jgi:hypothetical protein
MKTLVRIALVLLLCLPLMASDLKPDAGLKRIRFQISAVEERGEARQIVSQALVEGPPGTDFNIHLRDARFKMTAKFLTDLVTPDKLRVRARLDTRRLHGYSERRLPLYEEDAQGESFELGFDEQIVLLPFGRGGDDQLQIEISPARSDESVLSPSGEVRPLAIRILKQSPGGAISVEASRVPHRFRLEAALFDRGREVAREAAECLIEEAREVRLGPLALALTVDRYARDRPRDQVAISFDASRAGETIARGWAGVAGLGSEMNYELGDGLTLKFSIRLAPGETAGR